ncbi:hypothetical protein [Thiocystis violascens]|uniref:hypothetical protein n=1 Tax=Thiocystis violascens TaxID=73141 RepID=UPI00022C4C00|nr:hypothetical protein [Thiocystis violascens]
MHLPEKQRAECVDRGEFRRGIQAKIILHTALGQSVGVDDAKVGEDRGGKTPTGRLAETAVDHEGEHGGQNGRGEDESLIERDDTVDIEVGAELVRHREQRGAADPQRGFDQQQGPGRQRRDHAETHRQRMSARRLLKRLSRDAQADPEQDAEGRLQRYPSHDDGVGSGQTEQTHRDGIEHRIARSRPHGFPGRMADIDGRRKRTAEAGGQERAGAVRQQRRARLVAVARRLGAFQVLQRADDVEQPHRQDDGEVLPAQGREHQGQHRVGHRLRQVEPKIRRDRRRRGVQPAERVQHRRDRHADTDRDKPAGQPPGQTQLGRIDAEQDHHRQ